MPAYDGKRVTVDLAVTVWGVTFTVAGTVEILNIRKQVSDERAAAGARQR